MKILQIWAIGFHSLAVDLVAACDFASLSLVYDTVS